MQRAIVHVNDAPPQHPTRVDPQRVPLVQVVVQHRCQQIVRRADRREVAGEMQINVLHRQHLRVAAARRPALHAKHWTQRRLPRGADGAVTQTLQRLRQPDRGGGLAFPGRRRGDGRNQDQIAVRRAAPRVDGRPG